MGRSEAEELIREVEPALTVERRLGEADGRETVLQAACRLEDISEAGGERRGVVDAADELEATVTGDEEGRAGDAGRGAEADSKNPQRARREGPGWRLVLVERLEEIGLESVFADRQLQILGKAGEELEAVASGVAGAAAGALVGGADGPVFPAEEAAQFGLSPPSELEGVEPGGRAFADGTEGNQVGHGVLKSKPR